MRDYEQYPHKSDSNALVFDFISIGKKGTIPKRVLFIHTKNNVYNLAFGDYDELSDDIDDLVISDNGDSQKVLTTVAATVFKFFDKNPSAIVYLEGSTLARNRLYRMGIAKNILFLNDYFEISGFTEKQGWELFTPNQPYEAFFIKRKIEKK